MGLRTLEALSPNKLLQLYVLPAPIDVLALVKLAAVVDVQRALVAIPAGEVNLLCLRRDGRVLGAEEIELQHASTR